MRALPSSCVPLDVEQLTDVLLRDPCVFEQDGGADAAPRAAFAAPRHRDRDEVEVELVEVESARSVER